MFSEHIESNTIFHVYLNKRYFMDITSKNSVSFYTKNVSDEGASTKKRRKKRKLTSIRSKRGKFSQILRKVIPGRKKISCVPYPSSMTTSSLSPHEDSKKIELPKSKIIALFESIDQKVDKKTAKQVINLVNKTANLTDKVSQLTTYRESLALKMSTLNKNIKEASTDQRSSLESAFKDFKTEYMIFLASEQELLVKIVDKYWDKKLKHLKSVRKNLVDEINNKTNKKLGSQVSRIVDNDSDLIELYKKHHSEIALVEKELSECNKAKRALNTVLNPELYSNKDIGKRLEKSTSKVQKKRKKESLFDATNKGKVQRIAQLKKLSNEIDRLSKALEEISHKIERDSNLRDQFDELTLLMQKIKIKFQINPKLPATKLAECNHKSTTETNHNKNTALKEELNALKQSLDKLYSKAIVPGNIFRTIMDESTIKIRTKKSNWEKIKLAQINRSPLIMRAMMEFREQYVRHTVKLIIDNLKQENIENPEFIKKLETVEIKAFGSTNLTSDFDLTIGFTHDKDDESGLELMISSSILGQFNRMFRENFDCESGSFFDTNLYAEGLLPDITNEIGIKNTEGTWVGGKGPYQWTNQRLRAEHNLNQTILSLVKVRKFMGEEQWQKYRESIEINVADDNQLRTRKMFDKVSAIYDEAFGIKGQLATKMKALTSQTDIKLNDNLALTASNSLYTEMLESINFEDLKHKSKGDKDKLKVLLSLKLGMATIYAHEAYFSEGAIRDVVVNQQILKEESSKIAISPSQACQSLNENLGDFTKELSNFQNKNFSTVAIHASKYMGRTLRAFDAVIQALDQANIDFKTDKERQRLAALSASLQLIEPTLLRFRAGEPQNKNSDVIIAQLFADDATLKDINSSETLQVVLQQLAVFANTNVLNLEFKAQ